jgi:ribosomal protein S18 acetylase RimI-like enzyme
MITLSGVTPKEALDYYRLRVCSEQEYPEYVGLSAERELQAGPEKIAELIAGYENEGVCIFGAFDQRLVGIACVTRKKSNKYRHKAFLWGMYVAADYRGHKVGGMLLRHVIEWGRKSVLTAIQLQVTTSNVPARTMYERLGFEIYGTERASLFAAGKYHDVHLMELALKAAL